MPREQVPLLSMPAGDHACPVRICRTTPCPQKTKQICFCQNFVKFPPILLSSNYSSTRIFVAVLSPNHASKYSIFVTGRLDFVHQYLSRREGSRRIWADLLKLNYRIVSRRRTCNASVQWFWP